MGETKWKAKSSDKNSDYEYNLQLLYTKQVAGSGIDCAAKMTDDEQFHALTDFMREHNMYNGYVELTGMTPDETAADIGAKVAYILSCQKDTVITLADLTFRGSDRPDWMTLSGPLTKRTRKWNWKKMKYETGAPGVLCGATSSIPLMER